MSSSNSRSAIHRKPAILVIVSMATVAVMLAIQSSPAIGTTLRLVGSTTVLPASVRPSRVTSIVAEQAGVVVHLAVLPGDTVKQGQEIAQLESPALSQELAAANQRVEQARHLLAEAAKPGLRAKLYSEQHLAAGNTSRVACARADAFDLAQLEEAHRLASEKVIEVDRLRQEQVATQTESDRQKQEEQVALQALHNGRELRSRLKQECDAARAGVEIARLQSELEQNTARDQARVQYDNAVSEWKSVLQRLGNLHITARHDGTVLSVAPVRGEWIHSGAAIAQLADLSMLSMEVPVNGTVARLVKPGEMVLVRLPTDPPREVEAPVNSVLLQRGDGEYPYVVQVKLPNPDPGTILAGLEGAVVFRHVLKGGM